MLQIDALLAGGEAGRARLAAVMRGVSLDRLRMPCDAARDEAFLEPRLFAWSSRSETTPVTLGQLLFPAIGPQGASGVAAASDAAGSVFVAGFGHLETTLPNSALKLVRAGDASPGLMQDGQAIGYRHVPRVCVPGTSIEWVQRSDPLLQAFFADHVDRERGLDLEREPQRCDGLAGAALAAIADVHPAFHGRLVNSVRSVLLFRHPRVASFAALGMHGMIFLNIDRGENLLFFVDGFAHQGGHVLLSEATLDRQAFFKVHPDVPLHDLTGRPGTRSVYELLHGLYTEFAVLDLMSRVEQRVSLSNADRAEAHGRIALALRRFTADTSLAVSLRAQLFSDLGNDLLDCFVAARESFATRYHPRVQAMDTDGHGEDFDAAVFFRRNPITFELQ